MANLRNMARIFSLTIPYNGKEYLSLVCEQPLAENTFFILRYVDKDLQNLIPDDHLLFNTKGELKQVIYLQEDGAAKLLEATSKAIATHCQWNNA